jgi:hypothetical protein
MPAGPAGFATPCSHHHVCFLANATAAPNTGISQKSNPGLAWPALALQVICPSDAELCELHKEAPQELAAFKRQHLAGQAWADFCAQHGVQQAQPAQLPF